MEWKGREGSEGKLQYQYPVAQAFCALLYSGCDGKTPEIPHHLDRGPGGESTGKADSFSPSLTKERKKSAGPYASKDSSNLLFEVKLSS